MVCPCEDDNALLGFIEGKLASKKELCFAPGNLMVRKMNQFKINYIWKYVPTYTVIFLLVLFTPCTCSKTANHDIGKGT